MFKTFPFLCLFQKEFRIWWVWHSLGGQEASQPEAHQVRHAPGELTQACAATEGHIWVSDPTAARVCADVHGLCYHRRSCRCLWPVPSPEATLTSKGHAATGAILIWVACTVTCLYAGARDRLLPRATCASMIQLQSGTVMMSVACITTKSWEHALRPPPEATLLSEDHTTAGAKLSRKACASTQGHWDTWGPRLQRRAMCGSMTVPQLDSVLMSLACVAAEGHLDVCGLKSCWCLKAMLPLGIH